MNKAFLIGNLTDAPSLRTTQTGQSVGELTLAVKRKGNRDEADYIKVVVWDKLAENCNKYLTKGSKVAVIGEIRVRSYEGKNGKVYVTEVIADEVEFLSRPQQTQQTVADKELESIIDDTLPF